MNLDLSGEMQEELIALIDNMLDRGLDDQRRERLQKILNDEQALEFYVHYVDLHGELAWRGRGAEIASEAPQQYESESPLDAVSARSKRSNENPTSARSTWSNLSSYATAACLLLLAGIAAVFWAGNQLEQVASNNAADMRTDDVADSQADDAAVGSTDNDARSAASETGWNVIPTGLAKYRFVMPHVVELEQGELYIESVESESQIERQPLTIKTPFGEAVVKKSADPDEANSNSTKAYVATHYPQGESSVFQPMTRALVLSGTLTLGNSFGVLAGSASELMVAEQGSKPRNVAVRANNAFALKLYRKLAESSVGDSNSRNVCFSPYSVANVLAMLGEGARGATAEEIGNALQFPRELRRIGDDSQLIPWRVAQIHTGLADINQRLMDRRNDPESEDLQNRIKDLESQLAAAENRFQQSNQGKDFVAGNRLAAEINQLRQQIQDYEIEIANALWADVCFPIRTAYAEIINQFYDTGSVRNVDFKNNYEKACNQIASWIQQKTRGKLTFNLRDIELDKKEALQLIVTNAAYFRAGWKVPFKLDATSSGEFTLANGSKTKTEMMRGNFYEMARYGAFNSDGSPFETPTEIKRGRTEGLYPQGGYMLLELPYRGDELSMVIILPANSDGLENVDSLLSESRLSDWIDGLNSRDVHIRLPKFKLQTKYRLRTALEMLGIKSAFLSPSEVNGADFSGISDSTNDLLKLDGLIHESVIQVNEEGTEAAAFSAGIAKTDNPIREMVPFIPQFDADHPFVFLIKENQSGTILFMGRYANPETSLSK